MNKKILSLSLTLLLSACSLAPDFVMPETPVTDKYKSDIAAIEQNGMWAPAKSLENMDRGEWWKIFDDATLNDLETQASENNNSLKAAAANVEQARAIVRSKAGSFLPKIDIGGNAVRAKASAATSAPFGGTVAENSPYTMYSAQGIASYEVDLFGRVRDNEAALTLDADGQEALYRGTLLALQADVAGHYFTLRSLDAERYLLRKTVVMREEANRIMEKRFNAGVVGEQDISRTRSELATTKAELLILDRQRATSENALAVLLGQNPSEYIFKEAHNGTKVPKIPAGIPSTLLQRRPDVAKAQTAMEAANKRIGVARTAYFPLLNLTASGGYESNELSDLFDWSSRYWALGQTAGSALTLAVFDSGRLLAKTDSAKAEYEASVALYREQVLIAFKEVEDGLTNQRLLASQFAQHKIAADSSVRTTELTQKRYDQGDADYFEVVDAQRNSLAAERASIQARGQRLIASVGLIRALGGGW